MNIKDVEKLRDMNADFGIIPWPKFDETEDKYYTNVDADCSLIGVPIANSRPERTSIIIEALAAEGLSVGNPAVLRGRALRPNTRATTSRCR